MSESFRYLLEAVTASGVLYALYRLLLDRKIPYAWSRRYLIAAMVLGPLIPLMELQLLPAEVIDLGPLPLDEAASPISTPTVAGPPTAGTNGWLIGSYLVGVAILVAIMGQQWRQIRLLRRGARHVEGNRYPLVLTKEPIAPFSFLRTIYVWEGTPQEELPAIIAHETSHIAHGHTAERLVAESLKALLWWNPFVWLTIRQLGEVEEFEADHNVLAAGFQRDEYMTILFRQQFGFSPDISNGLPHSLTKKRFHMMTRNVQHSHALMRGAAVAATVAGLFCAFSLTAQATEYRTSDTSVVTEQSADTPKQTVRIIVTNQQGPIVGATIVVVGTTRGTTTDFNGVATVDAAAGDQLQIAYIGHERRTIMLGKDTTLIVSLTPSEEQPQIDEVVVKGYGKLPKEEGIYYESYGVPSEENTPFLFVEQMPTFNGGDLNTFRQWIMERIRPCRNDAGEFLTGRVLIQFVIERNGTLTIGRVMQSPDIRLSNEVIRVLASSPRWEPGVQNGSKVRVQYILPIQFSAE